MAAAILANSANRATAAKKAASACVKVVNKGLPTRHGASPPAAPWYVGNWYELGSGFGVLGFEFWRSRFRLGLGSYQEGADGDE